MAWTPHTAMTRMAVRGDSLEEDTMALWDEFLGGWYNGAPIVIVRDAKNVAKADRNFQQDVIKQPLEGVAIAIVWTRGSQPKRRSYGNTKRAFQKATLTFFVKSKGDNKGEGPKTLVRKTADQLVGILNHKGNTLPLARKGIRHVRAENPKLEPSSDYHVRSVTVTAELQYTLDDPERFDNHLVTHTGDFMMLSDDFWVV